MQYMDQQVEAKTGVTRASTGLSPDALQSTTAAGVQATVSAQAAQIEVMARNLAEGGMRQMFSLMLKLMVENSDEEEVMRFSGDNFVPVQPSSWDPDMDVTVNVGLGTGKEEQKMMALNQAFQVQSQIMQTYGPQNGLVSLTQIRNTLADTLALNGIRNADRYFNPMSPEIEQQMMAQQAQAAQGQQQQQPDPYVQGEIIKAQAKAQVDMAKIQADQQKEMARIQSRMFELQQRDDLSRDELDQELMIEAAKLLGELGVKLDTNRIQAMKDEPRQIGIQSR
jgi:hypothetical protein